MNYFELFEIEQERSKKRNEIILNYAASGDMEGLKAWVEDGQPLNDEWENAGMPTPDESLAYALAYDCRGSKLALWADALAAKQDALNAEAKALQAEYDCLEEDDFL